MRRRSCDELLVFDPFANEHKRGGRAAIGFDNTPSIMRRFFACHRTANFGNLSKSKLT
jgi:hypothetical protein